jgi:hypothetical protein
MGDQVGKGIDRHRKRARANGDMRVADANDVKKQGNGKDRAATANHAQHKTNDATRKHGKDVSCGHGVLDVQAVATRFQGISARS